MANFSPEAKRVWTLQQGSLNRTHLGAHQTSSEFVGDVEIFRDPGSPKLRWIHGT